jgi:hypothetical protein
VWDAGSKRPVVESVLVAGGELTTGAFYVREGNNVCLVTSGRDSVVRVWEVDSGKLLWASRGFFQSVDARGLVVKSSRGLRPHQLELLDFSGADIQDGDYKSTLMKQSVLHVMPRDSREPVVRVGWRGSFGCVLVGLGRVLCTCLCWARATGF